MRTITNQCDRCGFLSKDFDRWGKMTAPICGEADICPSCVESLGKWFAGFDKKRGSSGGLARAAVLSPERRQEISKQAAQARWNRKT